MARFQVYRLGDGLVVELQSDLFDGLQTRVVAPLVPADDISRKIGKLNPRFDLGGESYVMLTEFLGTVPAVELGTLVADLSSRADAITAATDFLFQGF